MFELKVFESEESEDTPRASQERLFWWSVRTVLYLAAWVTFSSLSAQADEPTRGRVVVSCALPPPYHLWCNSATGQCGVHEGHDERDGWGTPVP
jgi:hypothetical protein